MFDLLKSIFALSLINTQSRLCSILVRFRFLISNFDRQLFLVTQFILLIFVAFNHFLICLETWSGGGFVGGGRGLVMLVMLGEFGSLVDRADGRILKNKGTIVSGVRCQKGERGKGMDFLRFQKILVLEIN